MIWSDSEDVVSPKFGIAKKTLLYSRATDSLVDWKSFAIMSAIGPKLWSSSLALEDRSDMLDFRRRAWRTFRTHDRSRLR